MKQQRTHRHERRRRRCRRNRPLAAPISAPSGACRRRRWKPIERDVGQFLAFLAEHLGGTPSLKHLAKLTPADVRAFMAARRSDGVGNRSLMRALAGTRSFARFLERNGKGKVGALAAVRAPKLRADLAEAAGDRGRQAHHRHRPARRRGRASPGSSRATPPCWRCSTAPACASPKRSALTRDDAPLPARRCHHRHRQRQQDAHGAGAAAGGAS